MACWRRLCGLATVCLLFATPVAPVFAQATDAFGAARKLADAGKHRNAAAALSRALNSGTLSPTDTARGFYLRGVSYAKSGKNPQAISDLTNALWLTGLSDDERTNGYRMRAAAYKASGFKAKAAADLKRASSNNAASATGLTTTVTAAVPAGDAWAAQTASARTVSTQTAHAAKAAVPKPTPAASGNAVSNFFSGIFGGGASTAPSKPAATGQVAVSGKPTHTASTQTAVSSWSSNVDTATRHRVETPAPKRPAKPKQVAAVNWGAAAVATEPVKHKKKRAQKPVSRKKAAGQGRFNVQVATVRERAAAEVIRKSLATKAPKELAGLSPSIDTAVLGNMGTFYRVRVDGLPSRQASANLCKTLAKSGHDCFLITR